MIPGSTPPVMNIKIVQIIYNARPRVSSIDLLSPHSDEEAITALKIVAGMLIMHPVKISAFGC